MRNSPLALFMAMGTVLVATSLSFLILMLLAARAFAITQIVVAAGVALAGVAGLYFAAKFRRVFGARALN